MQAVSKTRVEADELSVQLDRGRIKYSEKGRCINIEIEHGVGEISIFSGSITNWLPPYAEETIDDAQKQEILDNACEAMRLLGVGVVVE